jgi:hypothetical protein
LQGGFWIGYAPACCVSYDDLMLKLDDDQEMQCRGFYIGVAGGGGSKPILGLFPDQ